MSIYKSILIKSNTIFDDGVLAFKEGRKNYNNPTEENELLAMQRAKICVTCRYYKKEEIPFLRKKDKRIYELSEMACGKCGCLLLYKTRQSIKPCSKWQKKG